MQKIIVVGVQARASDFDPAFWQKEGCKLYHVDSPAALLTLLSEQGSDWGAILFDADCDDGGIDFIAQNPHITKRWPLVFLTSKASINTAVEVMRLGARHFIAKPAHRIRILEAVLDALNSGADLPTTIANEPAMSPDISNGFMGFVGCSPPMLSLYEKIRKVANSRATIFVTGESGTGKEVCAEAIHRTGPRSAAPFIAINCGAIPENLLESELFGHRKGSFSGATSDREGAALVANGGTLFLDEICEMPLALQVKLLRFLQSGTVQRLGDCHPVKVDVRIICATNRHPEDEVAAGRLRADLFYRLNVVRLEMPPLRSRGTDIALLANHFLQRFAKEEGKKFAPLSRDAMRAISSQPFPGNVRELQNMLCCAVALNDGPKLDAALFGAGEKPPMPVSVDQETGVNDNGFGGWNSPDLSFDEIERMVIERTIERSGGSLPIAARRLQISPSTLYRKRERWLRGAATAFV